MQQSCLQTWRCMQDAMHSVTASHHATALPSTACLRTAIKCVMLCIGSKVQQTVQCMQEIMAQNGGCQILCVTHNLAFQQICSTIIQVLDFDFLLIIYIGIKLLFSWFHAKTAYLSRPCIVSSQHIQGGKAPSMSEVHSACKEFENSMM